MAATHYGVHRVSGAALIAAIDAGLAAHSPSGMFLVPVSNGQRIAVIGMQ